MSSHSSKEKKFTFIYFLVFYCLISFVFYKAVYFNIKLPELSNFNSSIVNKGGILEVEKYIAISDSINKLIATYKPGSEKMFHESSLNYELEELRQGYITNTDNEEYKILHQLDDFYSNQFFDKKAIGNSFRNAEFLKKNLDDCEIGFQQTQSSIQLQEALKGIKQ